MTTGPRAPGLSAATANALDVDTLSASSHCDPIVVHVAATVNATTLGIPVLAAARLTPWYCTRRCARGMVKIMLFIPAPSASGPSRETNLNTLPLR